MNIQDALPGGAMNVQDALPKGVVSGPSMDERPPQPGGPPLAIMWITPEVFIVMIRDATARATAQAVA